MSKERFGSYVGVMNKKYNQSEAITMPELAELIDSICKRPSLYTPTGTFYECVSYLDGLVPDRAPPPFARTAGHHPFLGFIKWTLTMWGVDYSKEYVGWKLFRQKFSSDEEALLTFPKLFREFLGTLE